MQKPYALHLHAAPRRTFQMIALVAWVLGGRAIGSVAYGTLWGVRISLRRSCLGLLILQSMSLLLYPCFFIQLFSFLLSVTVSTPQTCVLFSFSFVVAHRGLQAAQRSWPMLGVHAIFLLQLSHQDMRDVYLRGLQGKWESIRKQTGVRACLWRLR